MTEQPASHSSIVAMVSLASGIASGHPDMDLCQLDKLRAAGVPEHQIATVIEIARHIRDEAAQKLDAAFDEKAALSIPQKQQKPKFSELKTDAGESCCSTTASGQSCC
ncbi:MAG TPA: hypothetical protein ENG92_00350 [Thiolapillus brandeum]|uniref:Uncharacterized protein n=1 Tax=Thiolapillus brandeum TaxID=1076588 RepID=A0A831K293_9GAMM|nr:hypothetical protein [Thiolapillus brandeum]